MPLDKEKTSLHLYYFHALVSTLQRTFEGLNILMTEYLWNIKLACQYTYIYDFLNLFIYFKFHWDLGNLYSCSFDYKSLESYLSPFYYNHVVWDWVCIASPNCLSFVQVKVPSMFISLPPFYCSICVVLLIYLCIASLSCGATIVCKYSDTLNESGYIVCAICNVLFHTLS